MDLSNKKSPWDYCCAALLLKAYLDIENGVCPRRKAMSWLERHLNAYYRDKYHYLTGQRFKRIDIDRQMGLLENLMTGGHRGLIGLPSACVEEMVTIYQSEFARYQSYLHEVGISEKKDSETENQRDFLFGDARLEQNEEKKLNEQEAPQLERKRTTTSKILSQVADKEIQSESRNRMVKNFVETVQRRKNIFGDTSDGSNDIQHEDKAVKMVDGSWRKYILISEDSSIEELQLPARISHRLQWNEIRTVKELLAYPKDQFLGFRGMGQKSLRILLAEIEKIRYALSHATEIPRDMRGQLGENTNGQQSEAHTASPQLLLNTKDVTAWISSFADSIGIKTYVVKVYLKTTAFHPGCTVDEARRFLWECDGFRQNLRGLVLEYLKHKEDFCASLEEVKNLFPETFFDASEFQKLLQELSAERLIEVQNAKISILLPTLEEYIQSIPDEKKRKILTDRLDGKTLEGIAKEVGLTRERVRQIQKRLLNSRLYVREDRYKKLWQMYPALSEKDFAFIFDLPSRSVQYLQFTIKWDSWKKTDDEEERLHELREITYDFNRDVIQRERAKALLTSTDEFFTILGNRVRKTRPALLRYVVKTYARDKMACMALKEKYDQLLSELGYAGNPSFSVDLRYFDHLSDDEHVLWNRRKSIRYYDISARDYDELLDTLHLGQYSNTEFSAFKFFRDYPDLMREYDIRDEYELHNLLRKIWDRQNLNQGLDAGHKVTFAKMPILKIGKPERQAQILQLIREHGPVTKADLGKLYEETYGVKAMMIQSNTQWEDFASYYINGEYMMNQEGLPDDTVVRMRAVLTEDFYDMEDFVSLYLEECPEGNGWDIATSYVMNQLGFRDHDSYVIRNTFKSANDFFRHVLTTGDIVDLRDKHYRSVGPFYTVFQQLASAYEIVEARKNIYYTRQYLNSLGITVEKILQFCEKVRAFVPENILFTIKALQNHGFQLPWQAAHLENYFYESLLAADKENFSTLGCRGGRLCYNGRRESSLTLGDLFAYVLDQSDEPLSSKELHAIIQQRFGLDTKIEKIREFAEDHDEYADKLLL